MVAAATPNSMQRHCVWRQLLGDSAVSTTRGAATASAARSSSQQQRSQSYTQTHTATSSTPHATSTAASTSTPLPSASAASSSPGPRSGHAMTLLRPSGSVLLFGGSDGKIHFNDLYVLEPLEYAALGATQESSTSSELSLDMSAVGELAGLSQSSTESVDDGDNDPHGSQTATAASERDDHTGEASNDPLELALQWKQLAVTYSPSYYAAAAAAAATTSDPHDPHADAAVASSLESDDSRCDPTTNELPYVGGGRDYHSMHYVPTTRDDEAQRGMRVLVLGNILVAAEDDATRFEIDDFRIEEVRVRQPMLEAQWVAQRFTSLWRPRARQAHSSVLLGNHLYCFGGKNASTTAFYNDIFYFDVQRNEWVNPAPTGSFPAPRSYAGMAASRDKIYMYGGYDGRQQFGGIYVYDVQLSRWDKLAPAGDRPTARMNHSLTFLPPHQLILFGGREHSSRQNDLSLFDIPTATWTQLSPDSTARVGRSRSSSRSNTPRAVPLSSGAPTSSGILANASPVGRTAHAAVHYDLLSRSARRRQPPPPEGEQILIFGGYGGSLQWLNDLQLLTIPRDVLTPDALPPVAQRHNRPFTPLHPRDEMGRSQSAPPQLLQCSQSSQQYSQQYSQQQAGRSTHSSSSDTPLAVLSDITNQTPGLPLPASSASESQPRERKKRKRQSGNSDSQDTSPSSTELVVSPTHVGTQTAIIQLLQCNERIEANVARLTQEQTLRRHESLARLDLAKHNERLETQLRAAHSKIETLEQTLAVRDAETRTIREQLVAADAELLVYRQSLATAPALKQELLDAIQQSNQYQFAATNLLENKLAVIHDTLEEIRHCAGERTETDDSPQKKDSMFPDDKSQPSQQLPLFHERVVLNLEERLRSALAANEALAEKLRTTDAKLRRAEGTSERIRQLSLAWMHESDAAT